jgi:hypothetical protein
MGQFLKKTVWQFEKNHIFFKLRYDSKGIPNW